MTTDTRSANRKSSPRRVGLVRLAITGLLLLGLILIWGWFMDGKLQAQEVISGSMEPTLAIGDRLLVEQIGPKDPVHRGQIVIVDSQGTGLPYVKRLVGLPGDSIIAVNNEVYVNEVPKLAKLSPEGMWPPRFLARWKLTDDQYFVIGDNRGNSTDSVQFGPVSRARIVGMPIFRYYPWDRFGSIAPSPAPNAKLHE